MRYARISNSTGRPARPGRHETGSGSELVVLAEVKISTLQKNYYLRQVAWSLLKCPSVDQKQNKNLL